MAREFAEATTEIARLVGAIQAQTERLDAVFCTNPNSDYHFSRFGLELYYDGHRHDLYDMPDVHKAMERRAWDVLVDALGVKNVISVAKRKEFDEQLQRGELPPVCEQTILATLLGLTQQRSTSRERRPSRCSTCSARAAPGAGSTPPTAHSGSAAA